MKVALVVAVWLALASFGCSGEICRTSILDQLTTGPTKAPVQKCEKVL